MPRVSENERRRMRELYVEHRLTVAEVSRRVGRPKSTVKWHLRRMGVVMRGTSRPCARVTDEERELMRELYEEHGHGLVPIAARMQRAPDTVRTHLKRMGVQIRSRSSGGSERVYLSHSEMVVAARLYDQGYSVKEIAKVMDITYSMAHRRLRNAGVRLRTNSEGQLMSHARRASGAYVKERRERSR